MHIASVMNMERESLADGFMVGLLPDHLAHILRQGALPEVGKAIRERHSSTGGGSSDTAGVVIARCRRISLSRFRSESRIASL
jgi:hypothetical protein